MAQPSVKPPFTDNVLSSFYCLGYTCRARVELWKLSQLISRAIIPISSHTGPISPNSVKETRLRNLMKNTTNVAVPATRRLYTVGKTTVEATMFGNKQAKQDRLQQMANVIEQHPGISQSELAQQLGVPRSTVKRDLPTLEQHGILLFEDERGWLALFRRGK